MSTTVTRHRTGFYLTGDLAVRFTLSDHHASDVPDSVWDEFTAAYAHAHGCAPAGSLTEYVTDTTWSWDTTYTDGTVVIGDEDGPIVLEDEAAGPEGCRIVFWDEGTPYDTGLRVWEEEASLVAAMLRDKKAREED